MNGIKDFLVWFRNGLAFSYAWLVLCTVIWALASGKEGISASFLIKLFILCIWGVFVFRISFISRRVQKKGFLFSLTLFYLLFIPAEIALLYFMKVFTTKGSIWQWGAFGAIVVLTYVSSVVIDVCIMRKKAVLYTQKLQAYVAGNGEGR